STVRAGPSSFCADAVNCVTAAIRKPAMAIRMAGKDSTSPVVFPASAGSFSPFEPCKIQLMLPTIAREDDTVVMIDQRKLPAEEVYVRCKTAAEVARAIKTMVIRGAPAIGVAAAMGIALGVRNSKATGTQKLAAEFYKICELMAATRPDRKSVV